MSSIEFQMLNTLESNTIVFDVLTDNYSNEFDFNFNVYIENLNKNLYDILLYVSVNFITY